MFKRTSTRNETILKAILVVIFLAAFYFFVVHIPVENNLARIAEDQAMVEIDTSVSMLQLEKYMKMKTELDRILALPDALVSVLPDYDNLQPLMNRLNQIFAQSVSYDMTFDAVTFETNTARRVIRISFTCANYTNTRTILEQLSQTGWRSLITDMSLSTPQNSGDLANGPVTTSLTITYFEHAAGMPLVPDPAAAPATT